MWGSAVRFGSLALLAVAFGSTATVQGQCVDCTTLQVGDLNPCCVHMSNTSVANYQVVENTLYGTLSCDGPPSQFCGQYAGWRLDPLYSHYPAGYPGGGIGGSFRSCQTVCEKQFKIFSGFSMNISPGTYEFKWKLGSCLPNIISQTILTVPPPWDAPTCDTCVGDSPTACVHPYPRSLVISARPDLTLVSPLGDRTIERTYRTSLVGDATGGDGMFGKGWRANFEFRIGSVNGGTTNGVMLFDDAGRKIFYRRLSYVSTPVVYISPDGKGGSITAQADGGYLWQDSRGNSYRFDPAGTIVSIRDAHGNQETFASTGGRTTSLTDRHGRVVVFDYQGTGRVVRLLGPPIDANPSGVYASYSYDTTGNLTGVSYPDGSALVYDYGDSAWPSHMTRYAAGGPLGPGIQQLFRYDTLGRVQATSEGPEGRSFQLAYTYEQVDFDPARPQLGQKWVHHTATTEWTDANWNFEIDGEEAPTAQRVYTFENRGGAYVVTKVEDGGCSCAAEKRYDTAYRIVQSNDNLGVATLRTYGPSGEVVSLTEAAGTADERVTGFEYSYPASPVFPGQVLQKTTRRKSVASPGNDRVTTEINDPATGKLLTRREQGFLVDGSPAAAETNYAYTAAGAVQAIDGPRPGALDLVTFDYYPAGGPAAGMPWKVTQPTGATTTYQEYDALGNLLRETDANGNDTRYSYDSRGFREVRTTVDGTTRYRHDALGALAQTTLPKGNSVSSSHGQSGLKEVADATGRIEFAYSGGNLTSESVFGADSVLERSEAYDYDTNNRLWRVRQPGGDITEYLYDGNGNRTHQRLYAAAAPTVPLKTTVREYDFLNRLKAVSVEGDPYRVSYGYDAQGNLATVTDPLGQVTRYFFDDLGRMARVVSPETGTANFTHDAAGNVVERRDALNRLTTYTYDNLSRPTQVLHPGSTPPVLYRYDDYSDGVAPNAVGRLTETTDAAGLRRFFYDAGGRLARVTHAIDGRTFDTQYAYDLNGNLSSVTYPSGRIVRYAYDPVADLVQSVTASKDGTTKVLAQGVTHKLFGPVSGLAYGNGVSLEKGYDSLGYRLASVAATGPAQDPLPERRYDYGPAGNISAITRLLPGGAETHLFGYDAMERLTSWVGPGRAQQFAHDANGNRQFVSDDGQTTDYVYDPALRNLLAGTTGAESLLFGADPLGKITGWGARRLVYDGDDRLGRVEDGGVSLGEYLYNEDGQRVRKVAAGATTYFEYDPAGRLLHEYRPGEEVSVDYVYLGGEPLAMLVTDTEVERFTVTASAGAGGSLTPSPSLVVDANQTATFTVTPKTGYHVGTVSGCGGLLTGGTYTTAPITADCTVTATFVVNTYKLTTNKTGAGGGTVTSTPAGIDCGPTCSALFSHRTVVSLAQMPNPGWFFTGWSGGGCSGTGACAVTMTAARTVRATFSRGITVSAPNGGEILGRNTLATIRWSYLGNPGAAVRIELLKGGVLKQTISAATPIGSDGSGSYPWTVTETLTPGTNYRIRVTSVDDGAFTDNSNANFTIN